MSIRGKMKKKKEEKREGCSKVKRGTSRLDCGQKSLLLFSFFSFLSSLI